MTKVELIELYIRDLESKVGVSPARDNRILMLKDELNKALNIPVVMPCADLAFILIHKETKTEIEMPVLSICEEYSTVSFSTKDGAYNDDYNGIMRLPDTGNDTADNYDVYIVINGVRHLYDGLFYNSDSSETKRKH